MDEADYQRRARAITAELKLLTAWVVHELHPTITMPVAKTIVKEALAKAVALGANNTDVVQERLHRRSIIIPNK